MYCTLYLYLRYRICDMAILLRPDMGRVRIVCVRCAQKQNVVLPWSILQPGLGNKTQSTEYYRVESRGGGLKASAYKLPL